MAKSQTLQLWILILLALTCLGVGLFSLRAEAASTALGAGSSRLPQFLTMMDADLPLPLSVQGRRTLLENCQMVLQQSAPLALRFATDTQKGIAQAFCHELAAQSVAAAPTDAYAWLVRATAQIRAGEVEEASQSIVWSGRTGPNQSWIARTRFELVQDHYAELLPAARAVGDADTALLVPGSRGFVVARRYVLDEAFRQRAEALIEAQPEAVQRRFVSLIRRQLQGAAR